MARGAFSGLYEYLTERPPPLELASGCIACEAQKRERRGTNENDAPEGPASGEVFLIVPHAGLLNRQHDFHAVFRVEFLHDVGHVVFHRLFRQPTRH